MELGRKGKFVLNSIETKGNFYLQAYHINFML